MADQIELLCKDLNYLLFLAEADVGEYPGCLKLKISRILSLVVRNTEALIYYLKNVGLFEK